MFRLAQVGITNNGANLTSTQTQFNGQVQAFLVVNNVPTELIATISAGSDAVGTYVTRSLIDASGFAPASVVLRFNTSGVQVAADCNLLPFSQASTRTTCTLLQSVQFLVPTTPVCSFVGGTCAAPTLNISNAVNQFSVAQSTEKLDARLCDTSQLFVRGVIPTCANRIARNTFVNTTGILATESVVLKQVINPFSFTSVGDVPTTQLARANDYRFENPTSTSLSGASRSFEAIVGGTIAVTSRTTGFVKLVNAAHREFSIGGLQQTETSLIFVIRDSVGAVVHFEAVSTGQQSSFIELPTGQYKINTYSGRNQRNNILITNPATLIGTVSADLVFTVAENRYYLVASTTSTFDPLFAVDTLQTPFDITPATNTIAGTTEQQVINLLLAPSLSQDVKLLRNVVSTDNLQCTSFGAVNNGQSSTLVAQNGSLQLEIALGGATGCATCSRTTYASPATLSPISTGSCGKRVTVLVGRPYTLDTFTTTGICTFNTTTVEIGDLSFIGNRFSFRQQVLTPISFEIQNCACAAAAVTCIESLEFCDSQRIVTLGGAVGGVASSVAGVASAVGGVASSVAGVASAVGGVGAAVGIVQTQARNINGTLVAVRTQLGNVATNVGDIKQDIEEKNKGIQDTLDDVKNDVSDTKNDVSDIKKDLEENKKGLIDRVQKLSDECSQACDSKP